MTYSVKSKAPRGNWEERTGINGTNLDENKTFLGETYSATEEEAKGNDFNFLQILIWAGWIALGLTGVAALQILIKYGLPNLLEFLSSL